MNYLQFSKKENLIEKILTHFGIIKQEKVIIKINHEPDYNISEYMREQDSDYYFYKYWDFRREFNSVVEIRITDKYIVHYDNFKHLSSEYKIPFPTYDECSFLMDVLNEDVDALDNNTLGTETDNFKLNNLRIKSIDNLDGRIYYDGSFTGSSYEINPVDWAVYSVINISAVPLEIDDMAFYNSLLAESYVLLKEKKYKLSYFLLYSAFESFINYELGKEEEEGRLKDKINELFCLKFPNLSRHQIYTSIIMLFDSYTNNRNDIAHGRSTIDVDHKIVEKSFLFVLTMISSFLLNISKFEDLKTILDV